MTETLPAVTTPDPPVSATVEKRVQQYVALRDALKKMDDEHDAKRKPLVELQNVLTGWLQDFMETAGAENVKTKAGTCYTSTRYTASLPDPEVFMKHVIATQDFDLLNRSANQTAVRDYVTQHGTLPPGVNLSAIKTVGVRRASGK